SVAGVEQQPWGAPADQEDHGGEDLGPAGVLSLLNQAPGERREWKTDLTSAAPASSVADLPFETNVPATEGPSGMWDLLPASHSDPARRRRAAATIDPKGAGSRRGPLVRFSSSSSGAVSNDSLTEGALPAGGSTATAEGDSAAATVSPQLRTEPARPHG